VLAVGALVLFAMYTLSVVAALGVAFVLGRTVLKGPRPTLVLELPPYRMPRAVNIARAVASRVRRFLVDAGTVILALTIVLWALLSFPRDAVREAELDARVAEAQAITDEGARDEALASLDHERAEARLEHSLGGRFGHLIEPAIEPLGFDWKIGVGLVASFAAREVLVGTLGIVYGVGGDADETSDTLRERLRAARAPRRHGAVHAAHGRVADGLLRARRAVHEHARRDQARVRLVEVGALHARVHERARVRGLVPRLPGRPPARLRLRGLRVRARLRMQGA
jgi:ferrous iron transport protein B